MRRPRGRYTRHARASKPKPTYWMISQLGFVDGSTSGITPPTMTSINAVRKAKLHPNMNVAYILSAVGQKVANGLPIYGACKMDVE
jgi:hypothetical protein